MELSSEELFDVCAPDGSPTGATAPRSEVHRRGLWHRSSHLWLIDASGRLLLQQRHPGKLTDPGRWDIAVAGHLSAGEGPVDALVREAREELGLSLDAAALTLLGATPKQYLDPDFQDREWQHLFAGVWEGSLDSLVLQEDEVVDVRWMDSAAYCERLTAGDTAYVGRREDWPAFARWQSFR